MGGLLAQYLDETRKIQGCLLPSNKIRPGDMSNILYFASTLTFSLKKITYVIGIQTLIYTTEIQTSEESMVKINVQQI